jgi:hypothetical protein
MKAHTLAVGIAVLVSMLLMPRGYVTDHHEGGELLVAVLLGIAGRVW